MTFIQQGQIQNSVGSELRVPKRAILALGTEQVANTQDRIPGAKEYSGKNQHAYVVLILCYYIINVLTVLEPNLIQI